MSLAFSAPAKIILFGEHAVVYGQPAIAVPVSSLRVRAVVHPAASAGILIRARDLGQEIRVLDAADPNEQSPLAWIAAYTARALEQPALSGEIDLKSDIPLASGLGSGAAISAVLVRSVAALGGVRLEDQAVNELVYQSEKIYHGNPSGVDNTVVVFERGLYFRRNYPHSFMTMRSNYRILIADTGIRASTKIAVDGVRRLFEQDRDHIEPVIQEIGIISAEARELLESQTGQHPALGALMSRNHALLQMLQVSSPELDQLVDAAQNAGAFGAKLSGGGMGGNMIALVDEAHIVPVSEALKQAGAVRVIHTTVGEN